ncbi:MAG: hypothetical protein QNJ44_19780 [Rhodobacter sp.]|nr:hypothetical protein [Rhodobacter sp.]
MSNVLPRFIVFLVTLGFALDAGAQSTDRAVEADFNFVGADMRAYFEGPPIERARSVRAVLLVQLSEPELLSHSAIAASAEQLSDNVFVVPLTGLVPQPDETARGWLDAARCDDTFRWLPDPKAKGNIVLSFARTDSRACAVATTDGRGAVRFVDLLLSLERQDCLGQKDFVKAVFRDLGGRVGTRSLMEVGTMRSILESNRAQSCKS